LAELIAGQLVSGRHVLVSLTGSSAVGPAKSTCPILRVYQDFAIYDWLIQSEMSNAGPGTRDWF
jgi:hypothetical protein